MGEKIRSRWLWLLLFGLLVVIGVALLLGRAYLTDPPFARTRVFDGVSEAFSGESGRVYVIDKGKKTLLVVSPEGELEFEINGGSTGGGFYYASLVAEGENGDIFVADVLYSGEGTVIRAERIFRFGANGRNMALVREITYDDTDTAPHQYGNIKDMLVSDGCLYFLVYDGEKLVRHRIELATGAEETVSFDCGGVDLGLAALNTETLLPVWDDRLGNIYAAGEDGAALLIASDCGAPWGVAAEGDTVYFADLESFSVMRMDSAGNCEPVISCDTVPYHIHVTAGRVYACDNMAYYYWADGEAGYTDAVPLSKTPLRDFLWVLVFLGGLILAALAVRFVFVPLVNVRSSASLQRIVIVLMVSVCVAVLVSYMTLDTLISSQNESVMKELNLFCDICVESVDKAALKTIDSIDDYGSADYDKVRGKLDTLTDASYKQGQYYYYTVWTFDEEMIYCAMDYEHTSTARIPTFPIWMEGYYECLTQGESMEVSSEVSSYGTYSYVLKPIFDDTGTIVAGMEVGVNLDAQRQAQQALIWEVVLTVFSASVVLVMTIVEGIIYLDLVTNARLSAAAGGPSRRPLPLRTLMFLAFTADCLQDAFVSILANDLYEPVFGIPQSVGAALPISAELLLAALFSLLGGGIVMRTGPKRTMAAGFAIQVAGFAVCWLMQSYLGLLLGKAVIGVGLGLIVVSINSCAAASESERETIASFAGVNAGMLAGAAVGSGLGSVILSISSAYSVFLVGGVLMALGLLMALYSRDLPAQKRERREKTRGFWAFFLERRVLSFLVFMVLPFSMALAYKTYFFPIYAVQAGLSEANIAQIFLICGLVVIYAGPGLTRLLYLKLGMKSTVVLSGVVMALSMLVFAASPSVVSGCVGMLLLSVAGAFGFTSSSSHFSAVRAVREYGGSRAMGVYSLFDNAGQTLGPVAYGAVLILGSQPGALIFGAGMLILTGFFTLFNIGHRTDAALADQGAASRTRH